jgi:CubicO group peptidase (beta-lactamase class C family)
MKVVVVAGVLVACGAPHVAPALAPIPAKPAAPAPDPRAAQYDKIMQNMMVDARLVGASFAVVHDGQPVLEKAYGFADLARTRPLTLDDELAIGSITKQFTAAAVMTLVEAGKVKLDEPVATYVPAITAPVTVRELLNQTSGLPDFAIPANMVATHDAVLAWIAATTPAFTPGTQYAYSNTNYWLIARVVEAASGAPYDDYLRAHVLAPAGLTATHPCSAPAHVEGSALVPGGTVEPWKAFDIRGYDGAGELCSTVPDLLRWQAALFGGKVVSASSFAFMTTVPALTGGAATTYGAGLVRTPLRSHQALWHNGEVTGGFESMLLTLPDDHVTIVYLSNTATTEARLGSIIAILVADIAVAPTPRDLPGDPALAARIAGTYHDGDRETYTLRAERDGLVMGMTGFEGRLLYQGDGHYVAAWDYSLGIRADGDVVEIWKNGEKAATLSRVTPP